MNKKILDDYKDIITVKELRIILDIGRSKTYQMLRDNVINSFKIGNTYRIPKSEILKYIERQCLKN